MWTTTNFVEHPDLVSQRIDRFVDIVGTDRVIAGSDCGFGTFAGFGAVDPEIAYANLAAYHKALLKAAHKWERTYSDGPSWVHLITMLVLITPTLVHLFPKMRQNANRAHQTLE